MFSSKPLILYLSLAMLSLPVAAVATTVRMDTPFGSIYIELFDNVAPETVANFLNYVNDGDYDDSFIHRSVPRFVVQGGEFVWKGNAVVGIPQDPPVENEFEIPNFRGTIAMAKRGDDPDSATSSWFINLRNNTDPLDTQNDGFTVFGKVLGNGMVIVDFIATLPIFSAGGAFGAIPLVNYFGLGVVLPDNVVTTNIEIDSDDNAPPPAGTDAAFVVTNFLLDEDSQQESNNGN